MMDNERRLTFEVDQDRARLDRFLAEAAAGETLSRTRLKALIEDGQITVDGAVVLDPARRLSLGATVAVVVPPPVSDTPIGEAIPLTIVYEDDELVVVDKPAGLVVHPAPGHVGGTLVNALLAHCGASLSGIGGVRRPGIVHRLDKDTSGLLVVAKTDRAHQGLAALFADHGRTGSLDRQYRAFVWGVPAQDHGVVDAPLGRHPTHREKQAVLARGREAVTHWRREETFGPEASRVICRLETGRTHQIRVHLAHLGHPLIGDPVYGAGFKTKATRLEPQARAAVESLGRQALHAASLGFEHPVTGVVLRFESPLPPDLEALDTALRQEAKRVRKPGER